MSGSDSDSLSPRQPNNMLNCYYTLSAQFQLIDQDPEINCQVDERDFAEKEGRIYSLDRKPLPIDFWEEKKESEEAAESEKSKDEEIQQVQQVDKWSAVA